MIKIVKRPAEFFRAECHECHAVLEYVIDDIDSGCVQCPNCDVWISHKAFGTPFWKDSVTTGEDADE